MIREYLEQVTSILMCHRLHPKNGQDGHPRWTIKKWLSHCFFYPLTVFIYHILGCRGESRASKQNGNSATARNEVQLLAAFRTLPKEQQLIAIKLVESLGRSAGLADSTGGCNKLVKSLGRCFIV